MNSGEQVKPIRSKCGRCPFESMCLQLGIERVSSVPAIAASEDAWYNNERRVGGTNVYKFGPLWEHLVETVATNWRWTTLEDERRKFNVVRKREVVAAKRATWAERKRRDRARTAAPDADPLAHLTPVIECEANLRRQRLRAFLTLRPLPHRWRFLTPPDAERLVRVWTLRALLEAAGATPTAGKIARLMSVMRASPKEGDALRRRVHTDLKLISLLESKGGCWG